jgi:protein-tyrosine phosphatase
MLIGRSRPVVLCCSLGKDRTGMVAALLLARLGVPMADIGADFELSNDGLAAGRHLLPARWADPASEITPVSAGPCLAVLAELDDPVRVGDAARLRADLLTGISNPARR